MENIIVKDVLAAVGGKLLCGDAQTPLHHISIDSRQMEGDDLFVPFIGERVDAHDYIEKAFEAGAAAALSSREDVPLGEHPIILVEDTRKALQDFGRWYRKNRVKIPIVGITGSVGKTSTREMISAALSSARRVFSTHGNLNGQIGVPVTLSQIDPEYEIAVLEMGMSLFGEMEVIAEIARVDMAVVTNIGISHIENLESRENIREQKLHIIDGMPDGGKLILNGDDDLLPDWHTDRDIQIIYYGTRDFCQYRAEDIHMEDNHVVFRAVHGEESVDVNLKVPGFHNVLNALASLAVAAEQGVPLADAAGALEDFAGFGRRLEISDHNGITIIDDAYNASPDSMRAALQVLDSLEAEGRKFAVLADMLELGEDAPRYHYEIGNYAAGKRIDEYLLVGEFANWIGRALDQFSESVPVDYFKNNEAVAEYLLDNLTKGDVVLFKGSNSMHLDEIIRAIRQADIDE